MSAKEHNLTYERLTELLSYDPTSGFFVWLKKPSARSNRIKAGCIAGCVKNDSGYVVINIDGHSFRAHRLAWFFSYRKWPEEFIDHINHNKSDNRLENLRCATKHQNGWNLRMPSTNTSGVKGVCWDKRAGCWVAQCWVQGKHYRVGRFQDIAEAEEAMIKFRESHHKEFCNHG